MPDPTVSSIVDRTGDPASVAWAHDGVGSVASLAHPLAAIEAAGILGNTKALLAVAAPKDLRKAAAAALHKLKSRGIRIEAVVPQASFVLGKESVDLPSRAFLSLPEPNGDMEVLLTTSDGTGSCALGVILGAGGLKEMRHAHLGRGELRDLWKQASGRNELVEIPFITGLHYADRFASSGHDWKHFLEHISPATLQSARILDPLAGARTPIDEGDDADVNWLAPATVLGEGSVHAGISSVVGFAQADLPDDARISAMEALFTGVADAALADGDRPAMARASELAAASLTFHGRPRAAAIIRADGEAALAGVPGSEIPSVLRIVKVLLMSEGQRLIGERIGEIEKQLG
jgi:hypothetical protein